MKIFVTGATGVLGRATVPLLLAAGHQVRGLARSAANDTLLRRLGAEPVAVDLVDAAGLRAALVGCDAVLHLATKIPPSSAARKGASWLENDRLRREGTTALVDAALAIGVRTFLYPSVTLLYADGGARWLARGREHPSLPRPISIRPSPPRRRLRASRRAVGGGSCCGWDRCTAPLRRRRADCWHWCAGGSRPSRARRGPMPRSSGSMTPRGRSSRRSTAHPPDCTMWSMTNR